MSNEISTAFTQQYTNTVDHLLQQEGSRLMDKVMTSSAVGKAAVVVEQVGAVTAQKRTSRHGDTPLIETPHDKRWAFPVDYEWADLIDDQDKVRTIADFNSPYAINGAYALGRAIDTEIISAFNATAKTGADGTTNASLAAANVVAAGGAGMTLAKLQEAKELLMAANVNVERDPLFCAITAAQHDDLLNLVNSASQLVTQSVDFNSTPTLVDGMIRRFMGFNFVHTELLGDDGTDRLCPVWAKSGMHLCTWNGITTKISERDDKSYSTQVYVKATIGATRTEESKVVMLTCQE